MYGCMYVWDIKTFIKREDYKGLLHVIAVVKSKEMKSTVQQSKGLMFAS